MNNVLLLTWETNRIIISVKANMIK